MSTTATDPIPANPALSCLFSVHWLHLIYRPWLINHIYTAGSNVISSKLIIMLHCKPQIRSPSCDSDNVSLLTMLECKQKPLNSFNYTRYTFLSKLTEIKNLFSKNKHFSNKIIFVIISKTLLNWMKSFWRWLFLFLVLVVAITKNIAERTFRSTWLHYAKGCLRRQSPRHSLRP